MRRWIVLIIVCAMSVYASQPLGTPLPDVDYAGEEVVTIEDAISSGQIPDDMYDDPELYRNPDAYNLIDSEKIDVQAYFSATECLGCALDMGEQEITFSPNGLKHPNGDLISLPGEPPYPLGSQFTSTENGFVLTFDKGLIGEEYFEEGSSFNFYVPEFDHITVDTEGATVQLNDGATIKGELEVVLGSIIIPAHSSVDEIFINGHEIVTADESVVVELSEPPYFDVASKVAVDKMKLFNFEDRDLRVFLGPVPINALSYNYVGFDDNKLVASSELLDIHARPNNPYIPMQQNGVLRFRIMDASLSITNDEEVVVNFGVNVDNPDSMITFRNGKENINYRVGSIDNPGTKDHFTTSSESATTPLKLTMYAVSNGVRQPLFNDGAAEIEFTEDTVTIVATEVESGVEFITHPELAGEINLQGTTTEEDAWELYYAVREDMSPGARDAFKGIVFLSDQSYAKEVDAMEQQVAIGPLGAEDFKEKWRGFVQGTPSEASRAPYFIKGGTLYLQEGFDEAVLMRARIALEQRYNQGNSLAQSAKNTYDAFK